MLKHKWLTFLLLLALVAMSFGCSGAEDEPSQSVSAQTTSSSEQQESRPAPSEESADDRQRANATGADQAAQEDDSADTRQEEPAAGRAERQRGADAQAEEQTEGEALPPAPGKRGFSDDDGELAPYVAPPPIDGRGAKLLAIYIVGSDLEEDYLAATADLEELLIGYYALDDPLNIEIVVAFGGADKDGWRGMKLANILQLTADYGDLEFGNETGPDAYLYQADGAHMGDESSLKLFLDYLGDAYTGFDQRFLVMWDHGNSYKGFGNDSNFNGDPLHLDELERAFAGSGAGQFDLIGFDACLMASVEVARVMAPHAGYMIASEAIVPGHGWSWSDVVRLYVEGDDPVDIGRVLVDNFVQDVHSYESTGKAMSLLDLSHFDDLIRALDPVVAEFADRLLQDETYSEVLVYGAGKAQSFGASERDNSRASVDLKHFAELLSEGVDDAQLATDLEALIAAVDRFVVHTNHDGAMPNAHGIAIDAPENVEHEYASYKLNHLWWEFQLVYLDFRNGDSDPPEMIIELIDSDGAFATVIDERLAGVTTLYGYIETFEFDDGPSDYFMVVAEEPALPTELDDLYLAPSWDQIWFTVQYDPNADTAWIPAFLAETFELDGRTYVVYVAEIELYQANKDYSRQELDYDLATLTLLVELGDTWQIVDYYVETYRIFYTSPDDEEGTVQFDKATLQLGPGDRLQFWSLGLNLNDSAEDGWFATSEILTFVQEPIFLFEFLEFEDADGWLIDYYYAVRAEDASGNAALSELFLAAPIVESPYGNMLIFIEESGLFSVQVPQDWIEQAPDESQFEVFKAVDAEDQRAVTILVEFDVGLTQAEYADAIEQWLLELGIEEVERTTIETSGGREVVVLAGWLGEEVVVWESYVTEDGTAIEIYYVLAAAVVETSLDLVYYSFDTLVVY